MSKLFDEKTLSERDDKPQFLGPRRTVKVGGKIIEERLGGIQSDEDQFLREILAGVTEDDLHGRMSSFGEFVRKQGGDYRGMPTFRDEGPRFGEEYGSERDQMDDFSTRAIPGIDFERDDPYDQHENQNNQVWEQDDLGADHKSVTEWPEFEQSYTDNDADLLDMNFKCQSTHARRRDVLKGIFDDES